MSPVELPYHYNKSRQYVKFWEVENESNPGRAYIVSLKRDGTYACGCPRWTTHVPREDCKHIRSLKALLARATVEISEPRILSPEKIQKIMSRFALVEVE
jgi:hypothetical protein